MKKFLIISTLLLLSAYVLISCGGEQKKDGSTTTENEKIVNAVKLSDEALAAGKIVYKEKCQACHQENGQGISGTFPPLAGSDYLKADIPRAIRQAVRGSTEQLTVNGITYKTPMVPPVLTEQEHLDVINYILNSWGNSFGVVTAADIKTALEQ